VLVARGARALDERLVDLKLLGQLGLACEQFVRVVGVRQRSSLKCAR